MTGATELIEKVKPKIDKEIKKAKETFGKIASELKIKKKSMIPSSIQSNNTSFSHQIVSNISSSDEMKTRFKQRHSHKLYSRLKTAADSLPIAESKVQLDELLVDAHSIKDMLGSDGEGKMAELKEVGVKLNSMMGYEVTAVEIKRLIVDSLADGPMSLIKRSEMVSYMINKVTEENVKFEQAIANCYELKNDIKFIMKQAGV